MDPRDSTLSVNSVVTERKWAPPQIVESEIENTFEHNLGCCEGQSVTHMDHVSQKRKEKKWVPHWQKLLQGVINKIIIFPYHTGRPALFLSFFWLFLISHYSPPNQPPYIPKALSSPTQPTSSHSLSLSLNWVFSFSHSKDGSLLRFF